VSDLAAKYRKNQGINDDKEFSPERCGRVLHGLGFQTQVRREGRRTSRMFAWDPELVQRRCQDYGVDSALVPQLLKQPKQPKQKFLEEANVTDVSDVTVVTEHANNLSKQIPPQANRLAQLLKFIRVMAKEAKPGKLQELGDQGLLRRCQLDWGEKYDAVALDADLEELRKRSTIPASSPGIVEVF
jgi:hypothetical protein